MKKTILIICRNSLNKAPRFMMEVNALKNNYNLIAAGESDDAKKNDFRFIELASENTEILTFHYRYPIFLRKTISLLIQLFFKIPISQKKIKAKRAFKQDVAKLKKEKFDLIIVHHFSDLALAVKLAKQKNVKLIFNAHEYYPLEFDDSDIWMKNEHPKRMKIAKKYLKNIEICFCVGEKIAEKYQAEFNLKSVVITNAKAFYDLNPSVLNEGEKIKMIHHGGAIRSRKIELLIDMMDDLGNNYLLDLILIPSDETYIEELKNKANNNPNIRFIDPVTTLEIPNYTNKYDIGLFLLPPTNFNYKYALPNKFFEFIQARLAIAIAPSPEMAALVNKYNLGIVADDFTSKNLAEKIKFLSAEKIMYHKNQSHLYAKELSVEKNEELIKQTVSSLIR